MYAAQKSEREILPTICNRVSKTSNKRTKLTNVQKQDKNQPNERNKTESTEIKDAALVAEKEHGNGLAGAFHDVLLLMEDENSFKHNLLFEELSIRACNALKMYGVPGNITIKEFSEQYQLKDLMKQRNFGKLSYKEITELMIKSGIDN